MEYEIGLMFLILGLLFPRFVLFFWWLTGNLPFNTTPLWGDFLLSIFLPRVLFCVWIYDIQGTSDWFWIHLICAIIAFGYNTLTFQARHERAKKWFESVVNQ